MTRTDLLAYLAEKHGKALQDVGVELTDTQSTLAYILHDALTGDTDTQQKEIADREVARLITDKSAALPIPPEVITNVSDIGSQ